MRLSRRFSTREQYNKYDVDIGTLSTVPKDTFALKWKEIDKDDNQNDAGGMVTLTIRQNNEIDDSFMVP